MLLARGCGRAATAGCSAARRAAAAPWLALRARGAAARAAAAATRAGGGAELVRSVRAMPIKLISVSKGNSKAAQAMAAEWIDKLARYTAVSEVAIKPNPRGASSPQVQKDDEAEKVLKAIAPGERVVLLDERGREVSSEDVARLIAAAGDDGTPLCFVVGGPYGHGAGVSARADDSIRLSRLVLNHSVAHVVLAEQLYRGYTILKGAPYHH
ncbi:RNA methyltransferase [Scenedesmus sp. PABB004]|nr:RNA methyltransferase [Scenedesmus sp. PABB004]